MMMTTPIKIASTVFFLFVLTVGFSGCKGVPKDAAKYGKEAAKAVGIGVAGGVGKEAGADAYGYAKEKYSEGK